MERRPFPALETPRLHLRGLRPGDEEFLIALDTDPRVMQYIHDGVLTLKDARSFADAQLGLAEFRSRWGKWIVELRDTATPVGWVELGKLGGPERDDLQVGYEFSPDYWGQGYAVEAARAVVDYGFTQLDLDRVAALVHPDNERSFHLLRKLGFTPAPPSAARRNVGASQPEPVRLYCYSGHLRSC